MLYSAHPEVKLTLIPFFHQETGEIQVVDIGIFIAQPQGEVIESRVSGILMRKGVTSPLK